MQFYQQYLVATYMTNPVHLDIETDTPSRVNDSVTRVEKHLDV